MDGIVRERDVFDFDIFKGPFVEKLDRAITDNVGREDCGLRYDRGIASCSDTSENVLRRGRAEMAGDVTVGHGCSRVKGFAETGCACAVLARRS